LREGRKRKKKERKEGTKTKREKERKNKYVGLKIFTIVKIEVMVFWVVVPCSVVVGYQHFRGPCYATNHDL
jgi:hypothetical protein